MIISVDTGNKLIKTENCEFNSGIIKANEQRAARAAKAVHAGGHQGGTDSVFP